MLFYTVFDLQKYKIIIGNPSFCLFFYDFSRKNVFFSPKSLVELKIRITFATAFAKNAASVAQLVRAPDC